MKYQAYLYRYTHVPSGRAYIGIHKGLITDSYNHSSTCEEFNELLRTEFHNFKYEVLKTGSLGAMLNEEHKMLKAVNAKSNPDFFNKSNGSPASKTFDELRCLKLAEKIKSMSGEQELASEVIKTQFLQVREADDFTHAQDIRCAIDEEHGNTAKLNLQAVLIEGYYEEDDDDYGVDGSLGIGGNHSTKATVSSKHGKTIEVIRVPLKDWDGMTDAELGYVGMLLNSQESKVKPKVNETDDFSKLVQTLFHEHNIDPDSDEMREKLSNFNIPARKITSAINRAKRAIERKELQSNGQKVIEWQYGAQKKRLYDVIVPSYQDGETYVEVITSGSYGSLLTFMSNFVDSEKDYKKAVAIVRHPRLWNNDDWLNNTKFINARKAVEFFFESAGIEYQEVGLQVLQDQKAQIVVA